MTTAIGGRTLDALPDLATRQEVGAYTGISVPTLARWAVENSGPRFVKLGHAVRYRREDVLAWIEESAVAR